MRTGRAGIRLHAATFGVLQGNLHAAVGGDGVTDDRTREDDEPPTFVGGVVLKVGLQSGSEGQPLVIPRRLRGREHGLDRGAVLPHYFRETEMPIKIPTTKATAPAATAAANPETLAAWVVAAPACVAAWVDIAPACVAACVAASPAAVACATSRLWIRSSDSSFSDMVIPS